MKKKQLRILVGLSVWVAAVVWAGIFPGGDHSQTDQLVKSLIGVFLGGAPPPNPILFSHFVFMGIWPWVILQFWAGESPFRGRLFPKLGIFMLANVAGAYAVLPYESFRTTEPTRLPPRWFNRFGLSRWVPAFFLFLTLGIFLYAWRTDGWVEYIALLGSSSFVRIMLLDLALFHALAVRMMWRDTRDRRWCLHPAQTLPFLVPLVGPLLFLLIRPQLEAAHPFMVRL